MINSAMDTIIENARKNATAAGTDYRSDGLLHCGICRTPKEHILQLPGRPPITVPCLCKCESKKQSEQRERARRQEEIDKITGLRSILIADARYRDARFENDDGRNPAIFARLKNYTEDFDTALKANIGLCLVGGTGTGKTYAAACVANALVDKGTPAVMTNLPSVLNELAGFKTGKNDFIKSICRHPLLVIDDFGVERNTETALEQVYNVIDSRYRTGKPLIVTTNLTWAEIKNPKDLAHRRIFERIVECCQPVSFGDDGRREEIAAEKRKIAAEILNGRK